MLTPTIVQRKLGGSRRERTELAREVLKSVDRTVHYTLRVLPMIAASREDLVNDVMAYLYRDDAKMLRNWDPKRATFGGYLNMVARRFVLRKTGQPAPFMLPDDELPYLASQSMEKRLAYRIALEEILDWVRHATSPKDRARFARLFMDEQTPAEAAKAENASVEAIYTWMSRFKQRIKEGFPHLAALINLPDQEPPEGGGDDQ